VNAQPAPALDADTILRIEQLAIEDVKLRDEEAAIKERRDEIKSILRTLVPVGTTPAGTYKVIVTDPAKLDTKALAEAYPVTSHHHLYKPTLDTAAVRKHVAPVDLEKYTTHGTPVVTVK
jgi:hypothetical protein